MRRGDRAGHTGEATGGPSGARRKHGVRSRTRPAVPIPELARLLRRCRPITPRPSGGRRGPRRRPDGRLVLAGQSDRPTRTPRRQSRVCGCSAGTCCRLAAVRAVVSMNCWPCATDRGASRRRVPGREGGAGRSRLGRLGAPPGRISSTARVFAVGLRANRNAP